jgi:hypothetical protein
MAQIFLPFDSYANLGMDRVLLDWDGTKEFWRKNDRKVPFWRENDQKSHFTSEMQPSPHSVMLYNDYDS